MADFNEDEVIIGYGKELAYSDEENGSYTTIAGTIEVNLPERELGEAETTNDDSANYHKTYIPALYEPGNATFTYRYTATQFAELEAIFQLASDVSTRADAIKWWRETLADGSVTKFQGFLKKHDLPVEIEESPSVEGEIKVTGPMTFTAGVGS